MREKWATVLAVMAVGLGLLGYLVVYNVRVSEVAVHKRFGRVIKVIRPTVTADQEALIASLDGLEDVAVENRAGLFPKLPWPFDTVEKYDQRVRVIDGPLAQIQLADEYQLIPRVYATWRVVDPVAFEKSLKGDMGTAEQRLKTIIGNESGKVFGGHRLRDVVNTNRDELQFDGIEQEIFDGIKASLAGMEQAYGIEVSSVGLTWMALPQGTTEAVFARMSEERKRLAEAHRAEGESDKETKIAGAEATRKRMLAEAEADAKRIRAEAETEAARYYETFAQDAELAVFLRELEALRKITSSAADLKEPITFVLTTKTRPFGILEDGPNAETEAQALTDAKAAADVVQSASTAEGE